MLLGLLIFVAYPQVVTGFHSFVYRDFGLFGYPLAHYHKECFWRGGIPLWNPGEKFVAISSGTCSGNCPVYELYVFNDGRVVFLGKKDTGRIGVARKQIPADGYNELLRTITRHQVLEKNIKRGTCLEGRPMLMVMGSTPDGQSMITQSLNPGCEKHADMAKEIDTTIREQLLPGGRVAVDGVSLSASADDAVEALEI